MGIGHNIEWLGFIDPDKMIEFYNNIDILVFPSLYKEAFGMVVAEAMSNGILPISTGVGGAIEVITHGIDGLLVEPGESMDLYRKIKNDIDHPLLRHEVSSRYHLGNFSPKTGHRFSVPKPSQLKDL